MNEQELEQKILDKNLTRPRLTTDDIDSVIKECVYINPHNTTLTICLLVLENGTYVTGESSCVSQENFDVEIGKDIAFQNARDTVWQLEGYLLKEKLYQESLK